MSGSENSSRESGTNENVNLVDRRLEYHDPTPNIHDLFVSFNRRFFWGKLGMVEVKWSNRMTTCAGLCSYQGKRGLCSIKLSAPLLILRPRKDLVETLLHEMIHAYLFVTQNFKDRDDHGPEFRKHMERINREAGTNISVCHNFHYEVAFYQSHIWRCSGPCRNTPPHFGFVKRAMNRVPGPNDMWWGTHQHMCGGTFFKICQPGNRPDITEEDERENRQENAVGMRDIRDFLRSIEPTASTSASSDGGTQASTSSAAPVRGSDNGEHSKSQKRTLKNAGNSTETCAKMAKTDTHPSGNENGAKETDEQRQIKETVRNFWTNKYPSSNESENKRNNPGCSSSVDPEIEVKKKEIACPMCAQPFSDDVINLHVEQCLEDDDNSVEIINEIHPAEVGEQTLGDMLRLGLVQCPVCGEALERNELNDHLEICFSFTFENEETTGDGNAEPGKVACPCCMKWVKEININEHIDECLTYITLKEDAEIN